MTSAWGLPSCLAPVPATSQGIPCSREILAFPKLSRSLLPPWLIDTCRVLLTLPFGQPPAYLLLESPCFHPRFLLDTFLSNPPSYHIVRWERHLSFGVPCPPLRGSKISLFLLTTPPRYLFSEGLPCGRHSGRLHARHVKNDGLYHRFLFLLNCMAYDLEQTFIVNIW